MSKSLSTITRGIAALALSIAGLAVFAGAANAAALATPTATVVGSGTVNVAFVATATDLVYAVASNPTGGTCVVTLAVAATAGDPESCSVSGLSNGTSYTFTVTPYATTAAYLAGTASATTVSAASNAVVPAATPNAPTIGTATDGTTGSTNGTGSITLSWTAPTGNGVAITGYQVTTTNSPLTWSVLCTTSNPLASSCTWTPATARYGPLYVEALSASGAGAASNSWTIAVPAQPTGTPTVSQSGGNTTVFLPAPTTISATDSGNALAITKWTVLTGAATVCTAAASATSCTFNNATAGILTGSNPQFTVKAYNAAGGSAASNPSQATVIGVAPASFTATATYNSAKGYVVVSPYDAAGQYSYYVVDAAGAESTSLTCTAVSATSCAISVDRTSANTSYAAGATSTKLPFGFNGVILVMNTNPTNPALYTFASTNAVGPLTQPGAPASATSSQNTTTGIFTATWTAPADAAMVTSYQVQLLTCTSDASMATNTTCVASGSPKVVEAGTLSTTFVETPGTYYAFTVSASSTSGSGPTASPTYPLLSSVSSPSGVKVSITGTDNSSVTATWTAPTATGGAAVTGYAVQLYSCSTTTSTSCTTTVGSAVAVGASILTYTFKGLIAGNYSIGVSSVNANGTAGQVVATNVATVNQAPSAVSTTYTATNVNFSWTALGSTAHPYTVTSYQLVNAKNGAVICTATTTSCSVPASAVSYGYNAVLYSIDAQGVISAGTATVSAQQPNKPSPVTVPTAYQSNPYAFTNAAGDLEVSWTDGNAAGTVVSYNVVALGSDGTTINASVAYVAGTNTYTYVFPAASLTATSYVIQASAVNALGASSSTTLLTAANYATAVAAAGVTAPTAPTTVSLGNTKTTSGVLTFLVMSAQYGPTGAALGIGITSFTGTLTGPNGFVQNCTATDSGTTATLLTSGAVTAPYEAFLCTFTGVSEGSKYSFTAVANTPLSNSAASAAITAYAVGLPAAPTITSVTNYKNSANYNLVDGTVALVSWTIGGTGGVPISSTGSYTCLATNALTGITTGTAVYGSGLNALTSSCTISGLTYGTAYVFSVTATNANGTSLAGTSTFTTAGIPSAPTGVTASLYGSSVVTGGGVSVVWTAPTNTGGANATITNYVVTALAKNGFSGVVTIETQGAGITCTDPVTLSATLTHTSAVCVLTDPAILDTGWGGTVTFAVQAISSVSSYNGSTYAQIPSAYAFAAKDVSPVDSPVAPTAIVATTSTGFTLAWDDSQADAGASNTYNVKVSGATNGVYATTSTSTNLSLPYGVNGIVKGGTYNFYVQSVSATGVLSAWSIAASPAAPPVNSSTTIREYINTAANNGFVLTWSGVSASGGPGCIAPPASGCYLPVTYNVQATIGGATVVNTTTTSTNFTYPVAGLTSSIAAAYTWTVTASNDAGSALPMSVIKSYTNATTPGAVTSVVATVSAADATPYYGLPMAMAGLATINLSFTGPAGVNSDAVGVFAQSSAGAYAKISYTVTATSLSTGKSVTCTYISGISTYNSDANVVYDCLVPAGDTYAYSITTANGNGASSATPATGVITAASTTPSAPNAVAATAAASLTATAGSNDSLTVSWSAPTSTGGSPITGYVVGVSTANKATVSALESAIAAATVAASASGAASAGCTSVLTATSTTCTINGLIPGTSYYVMVFALNANGSSNAANVQNYLGGNMTVKTVSGTIAADPAAVAADAAAKATSPFPAKLSLSYGAVGTLTVNWTAAGTGSPLPVTYTVIATGSILGDVVKCTTTTTSCTLTGLSNGEVYSIALNSSNAYSVALATGGTTQTLYTATTKWTKPSYAPVIAAAVSKVSGTVTVVFAGPFQAAGGADASPLTGYTVTATDSTGKVVGTVGAATDYTAVAGAKQVTITGLTSGATYTVSVIANNAVGSSPAATASVVSLAQANPSAVTGLTASRNATGLAVKWTAPASLGSAAQLVGYWVTATDPLSGQQYTCPYNTTYGVVLAPAVTCSIVGLTVGTVYNVSVTAIAVDGAMNKLLSSAATATATYTTLAPEPVMATFLAVTAKQKSVSALSGAAKTALASLISSINDGAQITITGYGTTKAIALARANAAASYLFNNGAAVHVTIASVISKTVKTALVTVTSN